MMESLDKVEEEGNRKFPWDMKIFYLKTSIEIEKVVFFFF